MIAQKSISHICCVLLVVVFALGQVGPAFAAPVVSAEPAKTGAPMLQSLFNPTLPGTQTALAVCPPSISFSETLQCSINTIGESYTYTFTGSAGDKVLVRMSKSSGTIWLEVTHQ